MQGKATPAAAADLLATLRTARRRKAPRRWSSCSTRGVDPASVWDGLFLAAGELLMRQPGIVGLHCVTSTNALHYAYPTSGNDETRRMLMLQAAAFLPMFRKVMAGRGKLDDAEDRRAGKGRVKATGPEAVEEIFADVRQGPDGGGPQGAGAAADRPKRRGRR